jgi:flagellar biosynthetic protein FliR
MDGLPGLLRELPALGFGFMLVLSRVGTAMLTGPGLGEAEIPPTIRAALALVFAALVFSTLGIVFSPVPENVTRLAGMLATEIVIGAWMGFMTRVLVMALGMAGAIISFMIGLSSVLQIDPSVGGQVPALQRMMSLGVIALLFATGLYALPLQAIVGTYDLLPPGDAFDTGAAARLVTSAVAQSFGLALQLAAPFVITSMVWQVALGFISRLVPSIQVHVVSAPAQIAGGLALLMGLAAAMLSSWTAGTTRSFSLLPGL